MEETADRSRDEMHRANMDKNNLEEVISKLEAENMGLEAGFKTLMEENDGLEKTLKAKAKEATVAVGTTFAGVVTFTAAAITAARGG